MILSFHPCFEAEQNIICAGRDPGEDELAVIKAADAVILPQGCRESLHQMARQHCRRVFPNYDARFGYPGKIGQARLFQKTRVPHPKTEIYADTKTFASGVPGSAFVRHSQTPAAPFVFKFDWGGEGDNVFLINSSEMFRQVLQKAAAFEKTGQKGFLLQEYISSQNRTLRVVVIHRKFISYWRIQPDAKSFHANVAKGAVIDPEAEPKMQHTAVRLAQEFCAQTGINLAGFDFLFSEKQTPLFLEINYFFGRHGLGGSEAFYELLGAEIENWCGMVR